MNYIIQINNFWRLYDECDLNVTDIALYHNLLRVCNGANWVNPFKRNTAKILMELKMIRSTFEASRNRLKKAGLISFKTRSGYANVTYQLTDFEQVATPSLTDAPTGGTTGKHTGGTIGKPTLNKNNKHKHKHKPKQVVVDYAAAINFFNTTQNCRLLQLRHQLLPFELDAYFEVFYHSKIDLGDLDSKTPEDIARNFYYWLPKHLAAQQKEKSVAAKKENEPVQRGVAAALDFAHAKMWD